MLHATHRPWEQLHRPKLVRIERVCGHDSVHTACDRGPLRTIVAAVGAAAFLVAARSPSEGDRRQARFDAGCVLQLVVRGLAIRLAPGFARW